MKHLLSLLLFCFILESVLTTKRTLRNKLIKTLKTMKELNEKKMRKLAGTDEEDSSSGATDTTVQTTPAAGTYNDTSPTDAPESTSATAENGVVDASKPVAVKTKKSDNKKAAVQVTKFHGFKAPKGTGLVTFSTFFYFFGRPIVKFIIMRLRITYASRLRNLDTVAESARTDCTIENEDLAGKTLGSDEGQNVNYKCEANATKGDASTANFTLNTDVPMTMVNADGSTEPLSFDEVNFNGDSATESINLQTNSQEIKSIYTLQDCFVSVNRYILTITGELVSSRRLLRNLALTDGSELTMSLLDNDGNSKKYDCTLNAVSSPTYSLNCDTSSDPIETTSDLLHLSSGNSNNGELLNVEMANANSTTPIVTSSGSSRYTYSKSSSGLSGGAIAGIVIACVVALAAASIAAIMLRKPSPPIENTTIVDLKNDNI